MKRPLNLTQPFTLRFPHLLHCSTACLPLVTAVALMSMAVRYVQSRNLNIMLRPLLGKPN